MEETKIPFRPVRCAESDLESMTPIDGHVIFTTDSRKIFAVIDGEFKMMGGSSGVFYGTKILTDEEKFGDQVIFSFLHDDIDGDELPAPDDLILNMPDGGFYRVLEVNDVDIQAQRIAISGGGSGTGGGTGPSNEGSLVINYVDATPKKSATITGVDYYIEFEIVAKDSAGDLVSEEGSATWIINGKNYYQKVKNGRNSFKVDEYLDPTLDGDGNKIVLMLSMNTGGATDSVVSKTWYVKAIDLKLKWDYIYGLDNYIRNENFQLKFTPYGGVDCVAHIIFDGILIPGETYFTRNITSRETGTEIASPNIPSLEYGPHTCEMYLTAEVNGEIYRTPSIFNEITFISGKTSTILTVPYYQTEATQYDTLNIPFLVYDPDQENIEVKFYVNDIEVGGDTYNRDLHYWPYTLTEYGSVKLSIMSANEEAKKDLELVINQLDLEVDEAEGSTFVLKASNFSSNSELRNFNYDNKYALKFSDGIEEFNGIIAQPFDWENGGLKTETLSDGTIQKYICVRQGTRMSIPYKLFGDFTTGSAGGKDFKVCFKTANCYDYKAPVLECYDAESGMGIKINAQDTTFLSPNHNFLTKYYENQYIELETEIWPNIQDKNENFKGDRFIMYWVDGIPVGVKTYDYEKDPNNFILKQRNPQDIIIGSDECDVYIYVLKIYERKLNENEHLNNFIIDAPNTNEMLARYHRNNITDNIGEISFEKLVQNNPNCHAYVYEIPRMTKNKKDKVSNCNYFELYGDYNNINNPYYKAINTGDGARIRVQGTSSAAYGVAAFNMRTEFQEGLTNKDGNPVDGWEVSNTAIPIDYVCTKVNVASCENANNVVNAEWYNRFQPYHDAHRRKTREDGRTYRDTMEFNSGVVFVKDNNPIINYYNNENKPDVSKYLEANIFLDTPGYASKPYYKMYAIGNMGNDKKNIHIFHDTTNPKACCVEVLDNQNAEHWMTIYNEDSFKEKVIGKDPDTGKDIVEGPYYEFRYSVEDCEATDLQGVTVASQEKNFLDFVKWMSESNPSAYTGEDLDAPVTYKPYKFKGFNPPKYENAGNPSGISLKDLIVSRYAGTYTQDTYEYRMAKMLNECEDHIVMDSVVFHYLFIQRHTMVDNVAKNTFWSTEDGIHWDLTKNYDNDTSDGNDNSGNLTFDYGLEILDKATDGTDIFNASPSVWLNFIHGLPEVQEHLYNQLELKGAWKASSYLAEFDKHQSPIPERCWIYDYFRKYIRPRQLGLDSGGSYLNRLEGGKKTHQRKQFENYQEFYMNSKYAAPSFRSETASIDMRLNANPVDGSWSTDYTLPVSFYCDCYGYCLIGGQPIYSARLKRGDKWAIPVGKKLDAPTDGTCYICGVNMIQTLEGLSNVYPKYAKLGNATKLKEISYGSDEEGYFNPKLNAVDIESNTMLQKAYIQNVGIARSEAGSGGLGTLNLKNVLQLKELKINGSTITGLELADGSTIELLYLNDLSSLTMSNLNRLTDINLDEDIYNTLTRIDIRNCPAFDQYSYLLALNSSKLTTYLFNDFIWTLDINTTEHFDYDSGNVVGIKVLEKLGKLSSSNFPTTLIGTIKIDCNCNVDEYDLYNKYVKKYPNLIIEYTDKVIGLNPAVELKFMAGDTEASAVHYRVLGSGDGDVSIGTLISAEGPTGTAITDPSKGDTSEYTYTFTGYWLHDNKKYYVNGLENIEEGAINFDSVNPTESMVFIPEFKKEIRKHEIKFHDYDGNVILQNGKETFGVPYGMTYTQAGGPMINFYYKDSSNLPDNKRYGFKGWSTSRFKVDEGKNIEFIDLKTHVVEKAMNLYPYYETEDVHKVATSEEYFNVSNGVISLKSEYRDTLQGKITIPTTVKGAKINTIGSFANGYESQSKITHVYFLDNSAIVNINMSAFAYCRELLMVDLPATVRNIDGSAFTGCEKLITVTLNNNITTIGNSAFSSCPNLVLTALPTSLKTIGGSAFQSSGPGIQITSLPADIEVIPAWTFNGCPNVKISEFGGGSSKLKEIGENSFNNAGKGNGKPDVEDINIHYSVEIIGKDAFKGYATNTLKNVYFARPWEDGESYGKLVGEMGFDTTNHDLNFAQLDA